MGFLVKSIKLRRFIGLVALSVSNISREKKRDAKRLKMIPKERVMAKPLMGPVPNMKSARAVIRVVTWESTMVRKALPKPPSIF